MAESDFEPKIIAFCCNWCSYGAADLAGVSRMQCPTNVRVIRVPCSGRVTVKQVLTALEVGADGVLVTGCLEEQCHYLVGNLYERDRIAKLKADLETIGLGGRVDMYFMSAAMANEYIRVVKLFIEQIRELGPSPLAKDKEA